MPVRALVEAAALFEIEENNVRVSLARLLSSGRVERDERGRYRLGPSAQAISHQLRSWRDLESRLRSWRGDYVAVQRLRLGRGAGRRRCDHALALLGFREWSSGFALRPNNLRGGIAELRARFASLAHPAPNADSRTSAIADGDDADARESARVFLVHDLDPTSDREVRALWDVAAIRRETIEARERLHSSERGLSALADADAMRESFLVGGRVLGLLVRNPLLPREILDPEPLAELIAAMKRYDRIGRDCWARFLARHDVPHRGGLPLAHHTPARVRSLAS